MVVFFDIDGTLIDDRTQILPDSAVRAVERLRDNGHIPVINTGRPYTHVDPRVRDMAFEGYICGCGMEVSFRNRWLSRQQPSVEVCRFVRDSVRACNMRVLYEQQEGAVLTDGQWSDHYGCRWECGQMAARGVPIVELDSLPEPQFMKFVTLDGPDCRREEFLNRIQPFFNYAVRKHTLVEYMLSGCSKARGMDLFLRKLGISREDTLAIGDSTNDLPMFLAAGHTVCMGGGMEELAAHSEFVTATVLEDGIEKALQHFHLI